MTSGTRYCKELDLNKVIITCIGQELGAGRRMGMRGTAANIREYVCALESP